MAAGSNEDDTMNPTVAVVAQGAMGAGVGARLLRDVASQLQLQLPTSQSPGNSQEVSTRGRQLA